MEAVVLERKVNRLPFEAHREVSDYLDFLMYKYRIETEKKVVFTDFGLVMPTGYKFDRDEANAR